MPAQFLTVPVSQPFGGGTGKFIKIMPPNTLDQSELEGFPSVEDLRVSAKTLRYFVLMLEREESSWPWWKRLVMDYPSKNQYMKASVKFDSIADLFEQHTKQTSQ